MPRQRMQAFLPFGVPDFDHIIVGAADDESAVVLDAPHGGKMADEDVQTFAAFDVPDAEGGVARAADNSVILQ